MSSTARVPSDYTPTRPFNRFPSTSRDHEKFERGVEHAIRMLASGKMTREELACTFGGARSNPYAEGVLAAVALYENADALPLGVPLWVKIAVVAGVVIAFLFATVHSLGAVLS